jgi:hypothetical protein
MVVFTTNFTIYTGIDFQQTFVFEGINSNSRLNLTDHNLCAKMRKAEDSSTSTSFVVTVTDPGNARVALSMSNSTTAGLKPGKYLYDILLEYPDGTIERIVEGTVHVKRAVTR